MKIRVIHGPNLNTLGIRKPHIYGSDTLDNVNANILRFAKGIALETISVVDIDFFQSNHEGDIVNYLQSCYNENVDGIIINPGALAHYSYVLRDALESISIPAIEVHISNISAREDFRHTSVIAPVCVGQISGLGAYGYICALMAFQHRLN